MGIENIIRRLQDVDKLKMILFDAKQKKVFEFLPKPGIGKLSNHFNIDSIVKSKREELEKHDSKSFLSLSLDEFPLNKRMMELMDDSVKRKIKQKNKSPGFIPNVFLLNIFLRTNFQKRSCFKLQTK